MIGLARLELAATHSTVPYGEPGCAAHALEKPADALGVDAQPVPDLFHGQSLGAELSGELLSLGRHGEDRLLNEIRSASPLKRIALTHVWDNAHLFAPQYTSVRLPRQNCRVSNWLREQ